MTDKIGKQKLDEEGNEGALPHTPLGWEPHPRPRQLRMQRNFDNRQLPAVDVITQSTASGQDGKREGNGRRIFSLCVKERSRETPFVAVKAANAS